MNVAVLTFCTVAMLGIIFFASMSQSLLGPRPRRGKVDPLRDSWQFVLEGRFVGLREETYGYRDSVNRWGRPIRISKFKRWVELEKNDSFLVLDTGSRWEYMDDYKESYHAFKRGDMI